MREIRKRLNLCRFGICVPFCCLLIFFKSLKKCSEICVPSVLNSLNPSQAGHFVGPDLGPNCLLRSSADNQSK